MATLRFARSRNNRWRPTRRLTCENLERRTLLAAAPIINEFMAVNGSTIQDEDGDYSDWIEILNSGDQPVELEGYWLTDRPDDLTGWRFPEGVLDAGETLLVYASGKDRDESDSELHANFRLSRGGEYLALVAPDGQTVVHQFTPEYPPQATDVSYGVAPDQLAETLIAAGSTASYLVPTDNSLQSTWNQLGFDDSSWSTGATGIGYETGEAEEPAMVSAIKSLVPLGYWRFEETGLAQTAQNQGAIGISLDGTYTGGPNRNASGPGSSDPLYGFDDTNSAVELDGNNEAVVTSSSVLNNLSEFTMVGMIKPAQQSSGRVGLFGQNDVVEFGFIDPTTLQAWTQSGGSVNVDYTLPFDEWHQVAVVGDGKNIKIYLDGQLAGQGGSATGDYGNSTDSFNIGGGGIFDGTGNNFEGAIDEVAVYDRALTAEEIGTMLGGQGGPEDTLDGLIATDVQAQMLNQNSSLYVRVPFQVDDPAKLTRLALNLQYDDGFVAYVNGIEVTRQFAAGEADEPLAFDATATNSRPDSDVIQPVEFDISNIRDALKSGDNVLAIHVLNLAADDPDLVIRPELVGSSSSVDLTSFGYLTTPTPDAPNNPVSEDLGPLVLDSENAPNEPLSTQPIVVTANVAPTLRGVAKVELVYRVMFGAETTISMRDDGMGGDVAAGDGNYLAIIPGDIAQPGEMVRWYVLGTDTTDVTGRLPKFEVTSGRERSPEYFGTLIADPSVTSDIPILHWWVEDERAAGRRNGTNASLSYNGEFYDSVFVRQRGASTANNQVGKTNFKFDFVQEQFRFAPGEARVEEFNLNSTATDKAYIRQSLAFETYAAVGAPSSISFPMNVRRNDQFYGVFVFIEEPDDEMLARNGLDDNGALYKMYNSFTNANSTRKKTRKDEDNSDLAAFISDVNRLEGVELRNYLFDNVNLPATLNYLVATVLVHQNDNPHKNHFLYRDTEGTGEWMFLPWDNDLTWGSNWVGTSFSDVIYADQDVISKGPVPGHDPSVIHPSHPLIGTSLYREWNNNWNRLMDAMLQDDVIKQMYLRRLRTSMDELLGVPGTTDSYVDKRLDQFLATMGPDTDLDKQQWANPRWVWGQDQTFAEAVGIIRNEYLEVRRKHLFETHSVDNLVPEEITVLVPEFTRGRLFVPTDDKLGTSWTLPSFDDSSWLAGETGVGYENRPRNYTELIRTELKPNDFSADGTSIFVRIAFDVSDSNQVEDLTLRMKYDDGFVAYLNGQEVVRSNNLREPDPQRYNSRARSHSGVSFVNFDISDFADKLVTGTNVLAIHALNSSATSNDMLILPELIDGVIREVEVAGIPHEQVGNPAVAFDANDFDASPVSGNQDEEYVRLNNPTDQAVDISDWRLTGGVEHTFRKGTIIPAGMSLYVSPSVSTFRARATGPSGGQGLLVQGDYQGRLSNWGELVNLVAADGEAMSSLEIPATPSDVQKFLRVTELNYNPVSLNEVTEYIELANISSSLTLDLTGVTWVDGPKTPYTLPPSTQLGPNESLVIAKNLVAFQAAYPTVDSGFVFGPYDGNLSNQGEDIKFTDAQGNTIVDFQYSDNSVWPQSPDGVGATLELVDPSTPREQLSKYYRWQGSRSAGGTPTAPVESRLGVVVNEVVSNPAAGQSDAVELLNTTAASVDLDGWWLSDTAADFRKYQFPAGASLAAGQYLTLNAQQLGFEFNGTADDDVWLVRADGAGKATEFGDDVHFAASVAGESWGRVPNGDGRLGPLTVPTLGADNTNPRVGPVVLSEVQYHPADPTPAALAIDAKIDADDLEFVEITNSSGTPLDLTGWRIRGGIGFDFADLTTLGVNQSLLVISFNPTNPNNAARLEAFRAHYGLDEGTLIVGGYSGQLGDSYDRVQLQRPGGTEGNPTASEPLWVDEVLYDDLAPWPEAADGGGASLQRVSETSYGNLANSWFAATPNPGQPSFGNLRGDFNGDGVLDDIDIDLLYVQIRSPQPDTTFDLTGDGLVDNDDRDEMIFKVLGTTFGDANLDGIFNSADLVTALAAGKYEDGIPVNAGWAEGDWDANGDFDTGDLILGLQTGDYVDTARPTLATVGDGATAEERIAAHDLVLAAGAVSVNESAGETVESEAAVRLIGASAGAFDRDTARRTTDANAWAIESLFTEDGRDEDLRGDRQQKTVRREQVADELLNELLL